jgi:hypothetical protein
VYRALGIIRSSVYRILDDAAHEEDGGFYLMETFYFILKWVGIVLFVIAVGWMAYVPKGIWVGEIIKKYLWGSIAVGGGFYVGYLGVQSMDFTKPVLLSFYWETIGYFIGSIVLFIIGRAILVRRLNKKEFIDKIN